MKTGWRRSLPLRVACARPRVVKKLHEGGNAPLVGAPKLAKLVEHGESPPHDASCPEGIRKARIYGTASDPRKRKPRDLPRHSSVMARTPAHQKHQAITKSGIRAQIRIRGVLHRKHFPKGTDPITIKQWLLATEMRHRTTDATTTGRFADDARAYLRAVQAMPTVKERQQHIDQWIVVFGNTPRASITADRIRAQLHTWKAEGKAASTVNHRRTALMHLFTVLDGKSAANPVKDVPKFQEPSPLPLAPSSATVAKILKQLRGQTKARAMVIAYTGIPHAQLALIRPEHVDLEAGTVMVHGRKKGAGTAASLRRLTGKGIQAFRQMEKSKAWGPFDRFNFRKQIVAACTAAKVPVIRPYDLRHHFASELYRRSGDIRAVQLLMGHSTERLTHRYTLGASDPRIEAAVRRWR